MTKRLTEDMKPGAKTCPHCGAQLQDYWSWRQKLVTKRCRKCRCRWRPDGKHVVAGHYCPLQQAMPLGP
jgi:hypothetical protein